MVVSSIWPVFVAQNWLPQHRVGENLQAHILNVKESINFVTQCIYQLSCYAMLYYAMFPIWVIIPHLSPPSSHASHSTLNVTGHSSPLLLCHFCDADTWCSVKSSTDGVHCNRTRKVMETSMETSGLHNRLGSLLGMPEIMSQGHRPV